MGSSPSRKIQLLGIAHPFVRIIISGVGSTTIDEAPPGPKLLRKGPD